MTSAATAGYNAGLFLTGSALSLTNEAMTNTGDNATFNTTNEAHEAFDPTQALTVQVEVDDAQTVTVTGSPTGGNFTLTFGGHTTGNIAYNAAASAVQSALQGLSGVGSGQVAVSGPNGGPWVVEWTGTLGYALQSALTKNATGLTGGTSPDIQIVHTQSGFTWTTQSASTYVINAAIGQVVFSTAWVGAANSPACRVSGHYLPLSFLAGVTEIDGTGTGKTLDTTSMQNPPSSWQTYISGERGVTLKLSCIWVNGGLFLAQMTSASILLLQAFPNQAGTARYQGYGLLASDAIKSAVGALNTEDVNFTINGQYYYKPS